MWWFYKLSSPIVTAPQKMEARRTYERTNEWTHLFLSWCFAATENMLGVVTTKFMQFLVETILVRELKRKKEEKPRDRREGARKQGRMSM